MNDSMRPLPLRALCALCALCALALLCLGCAGGARAEFSPSISALYSEPLDVAVTARVLECAPYTSAVTERLSKLVERMRARVRYAALAGQTSAETELYMDDALLLSFGQVAMNGMEWVTLSPLEDTVLSGLTERGQTPFSALFDEPDSLLSRFSGYGGGLADALAGALPAVWESLAEYAKESSYQKAIKNVGTSRYRVVYSVPKAASAETFKKIGYALLDDPGVGIVVGSVRGALPIARAFLDGLRISSTLVITRYLDEDRSDIGLAVTCTLATDAVDARKLTVLIGGAESEKKGGAYVYITAPAARGNNAFKILYTRKSTYGEAKNTITADLDYTRRVGTTRDVVDATASFTNKLGEADEAVTGTAKATHTRTESGESVKWVYQIKPNMTFTATGGQGVVNVLAQRAGKTQLSVDVGLTVRPGEPIPAWDDRIAMYDVGAMSADELAALRGRVTGALTAALYQALSALPVEDMLFILYDLNPDDLRTMTTGGEDAYLVREGSGT